jgi:hypothetical protein
MSNKIKAIFAAIGTIGLITLCVSVILFLFTIAPTITCILLICAWFAYMGYDAYKFFLKEFKKIDDNEQINS